MQKIRDNPQCATDEFEAICDDNDPGLNMRAVFGHLGRAGYGSTASRPRVAILREEGVNGHVEAAAAFDAAGFISVDVHLSDVTCGRIDLDDFNGLVACGGFSYGDALGAGEGWAKSILFQDRLRRVFSEFFERPDTFALGICNGCQMLAALSDIIPGAQTWPRFVKNASEQFEARLVRAVPGSRMRTRLRRRCRQTWFRCSTWTTTTPSQIDTRTIRTARRQRLLA
jgi:phosphoribosylformylglycinamidine synthase